MMTLKRVFAAAAILLAATYLKVFLPSFADAAMPAVRLMLAEEQVTAQLPEALAVWLDWS